MPSRLAVCGALAPAVFTVGWVVGGLVQPGYDIRRQDVSSLAAMGADHAWIVLAAICLTGALVVALAAGLALERGRWPALLAPLVGAGGVAIVCAGALRIECSEDASAVCRARSAEGLLPWQDQAHNVAGAAALAALALGALLVAVHPRAPQALRWASLATAVLSPLLLAAYRTDLVPSWHGVIERILATVPLIWLALLALGRRPEPRPAAAGAAPGRPRRSTPAYPKRPVM